MKWNQDSHLNFAWTRWVEDKSLPFKKDYIVIESRWSYFLNFLWDYRKWNPSPRRIRILLNSWIYQISFWILQLIQSLISHYANHTIHCLGYFIWATPNNPSELFKTLFLSFPSNNVSSTHKRWMSEEHQRGEACLIW